MDVQQIMPGPSAGPAGIGVTLATFTPDTHPEVSSVSGDARHSVGFPGEVWANVHGGVGTTASDTRVSVYIGIVASNTLNDYEYIDRAIYLFDASTLLGKTALWATLRAEGSVKNNTFSALPSINIFESAPALDTAVVPGDYTSLSAVPLATEIAYDDFNPTGQNIWVLNAAGLAFVNAALAGAGIIRLGLREATYEAPNNEPVVFWVANGIMNFFVTPNPVLTIAYFA